MDRTHIKNEACAIMMYLVDEGWTTSTTELTATNTKLPLLVNLPTHTHLFSFNHNDNQSILTNYTHIKDVCSSNKCSCGSDYLQVSVIHEPPSWAKVRSPVSSVIERGKLITGQSSFGHH